MPQCCDKFEFEFANVAVTDIPYTADMRAKIGNYPRIEPYYFDPLTNDYYLLGGGPGVQITFNGSIIHVDHGGFATGIIKLS